MTARWTFGIRRLPTQIDGDPPLPTVALWWLCDGRVIASHIVDHLPVTDADLLESYQLITDQPLAPSDGPPTTLLVASEPLCGRLSNLLPDCDVQFGDTPEVDAVLEAFSEHLGDGEPPDPAVAFETFAPGEQRRLLAFAATLLEMHPAVHIEATQPLSLTCEAAGWRDAPIVFTGADTYEPGFLVFDSRHDLQTYLKLATAPGPVATDMLPPFLTVGLARCEAAELSEAPSDASGVIPVPTFFFAEHQTLRAPTPSEHARVLAAAFGVQAFLELFGEDLLYEDCWQEGMQGETSMKHGAKQMMIQIEGKA